MILLLLAAMHAHAATLPELPLDAALKAVGCRPMIVSGMSAQTESFGLSEMAIELGAERFVRTDMGDPDGKLTVLRQSKKICEIQISLLSGVKSVFGKVLLLKFDSGSGSHWDLYDYTGECKAIGRVADKNAQKFADGIDNLPSCKK
jgi:hypothetical protein